MKHAPRTMEDLMQAVSLFMEKTGQTALWEECLMEVGSESGQGGNALSVIYPYKDQGLWVFDDAATDLVKEPFVAGADQMIDVALEVKGIPDPERGFRLLFSAHEFPDADFRLDWMEEEADGNVYYSNTLEMKGWLCPALLKYFSSAPEQIYVRLEPKDGSGEFESIREEG